MKRDEREEPGRESFWIVLDILTILASAAIATVLRFHTTPIAAARGILDGTLIHGRSSGILLILLCGFALALVVTSRRFHLYTPMRIQTILNEQRLSAQACLYSGLLLSGTLYLIRAGDISRSLVLITLGLVTMALSLRRLAYRLLIYHQFDSGVGTRNVLIIGTGAEAQALRHHLDSIRHLGYTFKGFIELPDAGSPIAASSGAVVGGLDGLFQHARKHFRR